MSKYYAVKKGIKTGIFTTWSECRLYVDRHSGAEYKSFTSLEEAQSYLGLNQAKKTRDYVVEAYVDGSFDNKNNRYSYGCVILVDGKVVDKLFGIEIKHHEMRNVAGEILGAIKAIEWAINHEYDSIMIYYDYAGIEKWATGVWKANKEGTKEYKSFITKIEKDISVGFTKIKAHSGNKYNDQADHLAANILLKDNAKKSSKIENDPIEKIFNDIFKTNKKVTAKNSCVTILSGYIFTETKLKKFITQAWKLQNNKSDILSMHIELTPTTIKWLIMTTEDEYTYSYHFLR